MGKLKQSKLFNQLNNMSIRMSFVLYALFSLLIGIIICIFLISIIDNYRMIYRKMVRLLPPIATTKQNTQYSTLKVMRYVNSMLIIKKNVQYTNMSIRTMFHILKLHLILRNGTDGLTVF